MKLVKFSTNSWTSDTHFMVSDEDYNRVIGFNWYVANSNKKMNPDRVPHYRIERNSTKEEQLRGWRKLIHLSRFILELKGKDNSDIIVDHKNSWLDNQRESLRITNNMNNSRYQNTKINKKSGLPKGVSFRGVEKQAYQVRIQVNKKQIWLGLFKTVEEAHKAYCEAAIKYFGEFAKFE